MPRSERAKELAAKQKAEAKALKLKKKTSTNPEDWGRLRQMAYVFKLTAKEDKSFLPLVLPALLVPIAAGVVVAVVFRSVMWPITFVMLGVVLALLVFTWRARRANFKRYAGQAGAAELAFRELPKKGWSTSLAITGNRYQDVVHRVVGPPGVILVGEGSAGRVRSMLEAEAKKYASVRQNLPVTTLVVGDAANQVPLEGLAKAIKKLPKVLKDSEMAEIKSRIQALDNARPRVPIPRGPMPTMKGARAAIRGK